MPNNINFLRLFPLILALLHASYGCDEHQHTDPVVSARQGVESELFNSFYSNLWSPYYYSQPYQARTPLSGNYANDEQQGLGVDARFAFSGLSASALNAGIFNNRYTPANTLRPFSGLGNRLPIIFNPNYVRPFSSFDSCTAPSGESGVCSSGGSCSLFGGRPSGSCTLGRVCCINAITSCGGSATLNNTYWQSPSTAITVPSTCTLTVKLDARLAEQKRPVCQVRLDFVSFSISQPAITSVCSTDTFQVGGASSTVPTVCGDNSGQHMYIEVPSSATKPTDLQLLFNFGAASTVRSWNIKIAMLPCGASYLAPPGCLQYFSSASGKVSSFNWKDAAVAADATRQLASQNYNICFRTELVNSQKAKQLCLSTCTPTNGGKPFSLSSFDNKAAVGNTDCANDFLIIVGGKDSTVANNPPTADRFCGGNLNPTAAQTASTTACTSMAPFMMTYVTNDAEVPATIADGVPTAGEFSNTGFCLNFQESA